MTSTLVMQVVLLGLLAVVVAYLVPVLIQFRRTARAAEDLLREAGPRIAGAAGSLDSVLGKTDRVLEGLENGTRGITGAVTGFGSLLSLMRAGKRVAKGPAALAGLLSILAAAWQASAARGKRSRGGDGTAEPAREAAREAAAGKEPV